MSVDDTRDHVRQPARRTGSIVLGGSGGVVPMAVGNPDEIEVFFSHIVVDPEELKRVDHVSSRPGLRRDIPGPAGVHPSPPRAPIVGSKTPGTWAVARCSRLRSRGGGLPGRPPRSRPARLIFPR